MPIQRYATEIQKAWLCEATIPTGRYRYGRPGTVRYASARAHVKKAGVSYLMTGCRDQSSFSGIIPVKPGWLVGMNACICIYPIDSFLDMRAL